MGNKRGKMNGHSNDILKHENIEKEIDPPKSTRKNLRLKGTCSPFLRVGGNKPSL